MKPAKLILISVITATSLMAVSQSPLDVSARAIENGGTKSAIDAYSDGAGVVVISAPGAAKIDNSAMNQLVFKYGPDAKTNGIQLGAQVKTIATATSTAAEKLLADQIGVTNVVTAATIPTGEEVFQTPGTFSWVAPAGVTSVSVVCVGGGGAGATLYSGGGGGALVWKNNVAVSSGSSYSVVVGAGGSLSDGSSSMFNGTIIAGGGGRGTPHTNFSGYAKVNVGIPGTYSGGDGGGAGGYGGDDWGGDGGGGGGAGGYTGNGGDGNNWQTPNTGYNPTSGYGGGGGGGAYGYSGGNIGGGGGGGVGLYGEGLSGGGGNPGTSGASSMRGLGGSNGIDGLSGVAGLGGKGGAYGGGGGAYNGGGGKGACRIIWGSGRLFPSTNVDITSSNGNVTTH